MEADIYWMWLQRAFGPGSPKPFYIYNRFKNLEEFYKEGIALWSSMSFINGKELAVLKTFSPQNAEDEIEYTEKLGHYIITPYSRNYPELLMNIENPPAVLYVKGELPNFEESVGITIVGTRKPSKEAEIFTKSIAYELSLEGVNVISGGALGVDAAAHRGAINGTTPTVCVLACGIDYPYLMENQMLRERIVAQGGALISEYPVNTAVNKGSFLIRNRLMSGFSRGTLVVECSLKSGTMITVKHATAQNRDVFAVPGDENNLMASGPNSLISDGAKPVNCARDILEEYEHIIKNKRRVAAAPVLKDKDSHVFNIQSEIKDKLSVDAINVLSFLEREPMHISILAESTNLRPSKILAVVTELEIYGLIKTYSGQRYSLK